MHFIVMIAVKILIPLKYYLDKNAEGLTIFYRVSCLFKFGGCFFGGFYFFPRVVWFLGFIFGTSRKMVFIGAYVEKKHRHRQEIL